MQNLQPVAGTFDEAAAERLDLSLHIFTDRLHFSVAERSVDGCEEGKLLISGKLLFARELVRDNASPVADLIYAHPFLTFSYHSVRIRFVATSYLLIPPGLEDDLLNERWLATTQLPIQERDYVGAFSFASLEAPQVIAAWYRETFNFLRRTYIDADIAPLVIDVLASARRLSLLCSGRVFYFLVERGMIDVAVLHRGEVLFCNRFETSPYVEQLPVSCEANLPTQEDTLLSDEASESESGEDVKELSRTEVLAEQLLFYWAAVCKTLAIENLADDTLRLFLPSSMLALSDKADRLVEVLTKETEAVGVSFEQLSYHDLAPKGI